MLKALRTPVGVQSLLVTLLIVGCSTDGELSAPADGSITMNIARMEGSSVPLEADSALVRVWHPTAGTNQVRRVAIPAPGETTSLQLLLPARSGYSIGILAFVNTVFDVVAGGFQAGVDVEVGQESEVAVQVRPWEYVIDAPDTIVAGEEATFILEVTQGPVSELFDWGRLHIGLDPSALTAVVGDLNDNRFTVTFNAPTVDADTTVWFQFDLRVQIRVDDWQTSGIRAFLPSQTLGDTLRTTPLTLPEGVVTISFSEDMR
jgi:hypothetical protein